MNTSKFVIMLTGLVVMALLVGAVFLPVVSSSTNRTITTIEENEEPGWLKFGYSATDNYNFNVEIDGDNLTVGSQTGELYDMMVLSTDVLAIVIDGDSIVAVSENGAVDLGTTASVVKTSSGLTVGDTTYSAPLWSYYPNASGKYAYFDHADLVTDDAPLSAWGNFAGVYAYSDFTVPDLGLIVDATVTDGVIEGVIWGTAPDTLDIQPFHPGDVIFNPIDLNPIDVDLEPIDLGGGDNQIMSADPSNGTRIGDLYYTFSGTNATVIGYASTIDWSTFTTIPDTVVNGGVTYNVTKIGNQAFNLCSNLALTSLPDSITTIGTGAFNYCSSLALTSLPSSLIGLGTGGAFNGCTNLALTSLPSGLTSIPGNTFNGCTNLALTSLPDGITFIDANAFYNCTNLALTSLPDGLTLIRDGTFYNCTNLALTSLPAGVTSIGESAFEGCTNLALTSLPDSITSIGTGAFKDCTSLALTLLPSGLTSIGNNAFQNCIGIKSIVLYTPSVHANAFNGCLINGLVVVDAPTLVNTSFSNSGISEVLNLGSLEITTTTGGMDAQEVRTDIEAVGYIAPLSIVVGSETIRVDSPTADVIDILPIVVGVGLLLIALGVLIYRRT